MKIFILCSGRQDRWNRQVLFPQFPIKHLVEINGEPLLKRTIRQLREKNLEPIIVTKNEALKLCETIDPEDCTFTVSSLYSTRHYWDKDRNIILLGDVVFSDKVLKLILKNKDPIKFIGSRSEIFAISFSNNQNMLEKLQEAIKYSHENDTRYSGKLWLLYRMTCKLPLELHQLEKSVYKKVKRDISRDFDKQSEYLNYLKEYEPRNNN